MGIFDRINKVVSSNMNALLDKAEDPQKMVDLWLVKMRDQIKLGKQQLVSAVAEEKMLRTKVQQAEDQILKWQQRAELAVTSGDDNLARQALLMRKRAKAERDSVEAMRVTQRAQALELRDDLAKAEKKLQEFEATKATIVARYKQARAGGGAEALGASGAVNAFDEFRRMEDKMEQTHAQIQAMQEVQGVLESTAGATMSESELEMRFAELDAKQAGSKSESTSPSDPVEDELETLRKKLRVEI